jgi:hypothetical protein
MRVNLYQLAVLSICIIFFSGCSLHRDKKAEKMYSLGASLTKLCASVESTVRYKNPPENITDYELFLLSTKHDPSLLEPFTEYFKKILRCDRHAVILVCTPDRGKGLLEDACCTTGLDNNLWQYDSLPCDFTIDVQERCRAP